MNSGVGARIPMMVFCASLVCLLSVSAGEKTVKAVEGLKFEPVRFSVEAGEKVGLKFVNADQNDLPHNLVIGTPGSLKKLVEEAMKMGAQQMSATTTLLGGGS